MLLQSSIYMYIFFYRRSFRAVYGFSSGTCSLKSVQRWWYLVISAVIFLIINCDSACANHILAPSAQNWGNFMDTAFFLPSFLFRGHHCEEYIFTDILGYKYITNYINMLRIKLEYLLLFLFLIRLAPGFSFTPSQILSFHLLMILSLWSLQYTYTVRWAILIYIVSIYLSINRCIDR